MDELFAEPVPYYQLTGAEIEAQRRRHRMAQMVANSATAPEGERTRAEEEMHEIETRLVMSGATVEPTQLDRLQAEFDEAAAAMQPPNGLKSLPLEEQETRKARWREAFRAFADAKAAATRAARASGADVRTAVGGEGESASNEAQEFMPPRPYWE